MAQNKKSLISQVGVAKGSPRPVSRQVAEKQAPKVSDKYLLQKFTREFDQVTTIVFSLPGSEQAEPNELNHVRFREFFVHMGMLSEQ